MKTIGGFIVYELHTKRIIKIHNHHKTALTMLYRLGTDRYRIKETADRFFYEVQGYIR
jgi:hypothetical protein